MKTVHDIVFSNPGARGERVALREKRRKWTYADLQSAVACFAAGCERAGLARGDRVAVYLPKQLETVAAIFGAAAGGYAAVPVNPALKAPQVDHILKDSGAALLVTSADRLQSLGASPAATLVVARDGGFANPDFSIESAAPRQPPAPDELAAILYTSGSTGQPKGVMLSHANLTLGADSVVTYLSNTSDDRILALLPLSFDYGLNQLTSAFYAGAEAVLHNYLLPQAVVKDVAAYQITGLGCVPPLWLQLVDQDWPEEARRSLRYLTNSGGHLPRSLIERLRALFPQAQIFPMYGLTEAFRSTFLDPDLVAHKPDSMGRAIPHAEVLVVRPDGTATEPGEPGELVHMGPLVAHGYWRDAERTAERFRPAPIAAGAERRGEVAVWSGDRVKRDEDGFLYFVGRMDDMIKTLGNRVSPTEVEEAVLSSGLVREAVALGVPDERLGEAIYVVATAAGGQLGDSEAVMQHCRRVLPGFMVPTKIIWRDILPRNQNGKFDRPQIARSLARVSA